MDKAAVTLADKLMGLGRKSTVSKSNSGSTSKKPVWGGPCGDGPECGITYSLLSRFLADRERFRLIVVEGLKPEDTFNHRIHYGSMWHVCEEYHSRGGRNAYPSWEQALVAYARDLCMRYRSQQSQIDHWYRVCRAQFPIYIQYWQERYSQHQESRIIRVLEEQVFNVAYTLPSGRVVKLRGKWDGVDAVSSSAGSKTYNDIWLFETKTKGDIRPGQIQRQLSFDLQTMMYVVALEEYYKLASQSDKISYTIRGICYNTIRRPLSGGKGTIVRHKGRNGKGEETKDHFYERVAGYIRTSPDWYFMRWSVNLCQQDIEKFRTQCLNPILEQLCDWWEWIKYAGEDPFLQDASKMPFPTYGIHWRHPYGVYNPLDEGGSSDYDEYLESGSEEGLARVNDLFPELGTSEIA